MTTTQYLGLPFIEGSQAQKHVTHNEALRILDAVVQIAVRDADRIAPPASPGEGDRHIVALGATGAWAGHAKAIALYEDGGWRFLAPAAGWCAWSVADGALLVYDGAAWDEVAGGGGGGDGLSDTDRRNALLDRISQSKLLGAPRRVIDAWASGFKGATDAANGIDAGASSGVDTSNAATGGYVRPASSVVQQIPVMTGSTTSGVTLSASDVQAGYDAYKAADGAPVNLTLNDYASNAAPSTGTPITLTVDFGSGNAKTISSYQLAASAYASSGFNTYMAKDWKLQGSNDNANWTDLDTQSGAAAWGLGETRTYNFANAIAYRYYRWRFTAHQGGGALIVGRVALSSVVSADMTLTTLPQTTDGTIGRARAIVEFDDGAAPALNTDLVIEVTCDGGTNWASAALSAVTSHGQGGRKVAETADTPCAVGTSFAARIRTAGKNVPIYGVAIAVR
jgi:hypothetical protein